MSGLLAAKISVQKRVLFPLTADGGRGTVSRQNLSFIRQLEKLGFDAFHQLRATAIGEIRAAYSIKEEDVSSENDTELGLEKAEAIGRVAGDVHEFPLISAKTGGLGVSQNGVHGESIDRKGAASPHSVEALEGEISRKRSKGKNLCAEAILDLCGIHHVVKMLVGEQEDIDRGTSGG